MLLFGAFVLQSFLLCIKYSEYAPAQKMSENFVTLICIYKSSRTEKVIKCSVCFAKYCICFNIVRNMDIMPQCFYTYSKFVNFTSAVPGTFKSCMLHLFSDVHSILGAEKL